MSKLTLDALRALREQQKLAMTKRDPAGKDTQIVVAMGTCGLAAGARATFNAFVEALDQKGITNVIVRQSGCMGLCNSEPTVEVIAPDLPDVIYGKVDAALAQTIVEKHIIGKKLVDSHICDRPADNTK